MLKEMRPTLSKLDNERQSYYNFKFPAHAKSQKSVLPLKNLLYVQSIYQSEILRGLQTDNILRYKGMIWREATLRHLLNI